MSLKKIYKQSIVYPGIILLIISLVYSIIYFLTYTREKHEYYQEWYEIVVINLATSLVFSTLIGVFSLTIFLNKLKKISSSSTLSILSWFLFPFGFICLVIGKAINELITVGSTWEITYALIACIPYIIGLVKGFRKYKALDNID